MDLKHLAALYFVGALLVSAGLAFFDWRLGMISAGALIALPVLLLKEKE